MEKATRDWLMAIASLCGCRFEWIEDREFHLSYGNRQMKVEFFTENPGTILFHGIDKIKNRIN